MQSALYCIVQLAVKLKDRAVDQGAGGCRGVKDTGGGVDAAMDWQLLETGIVTVVSIWVFLFSPSPLSRTVAGAVFGINLLWALLERERPPLRQAAPPVPDADSPAKGRVI